MSYCGTCGGFYSPECPHRSAGSGGVSCMPCANPHDEKHVAALAAIAVANAEVAGMQATNDYLKIIGNEPQHFATDFGAVAARLLEAVKS